MKICGNKKILVIALFFLFSIIFFFYVTCNDAPVKSMHLSSRSLIRVTADCLEYCISQKDKLFLDSQQQRAYTDTIELSIQFYGIKGIIGIAEYNESYYKNFLDGYHSTSYFFVVSSLFFGPFEGESVTY